MPLKPDEELYGVSHPRKENSSRSMRPKRPSAGVRWLPNHSARAADVQGAVAGDPAGRGAVTRLMAETMGRPVSDPDVQAAIARPPCVDRELLPVLCGDVRGLGQMYVDDPRFTATYDKVRPGLAVFMRDADGVLRRAHADEVTRRPSRSRANRRLARSSKAFFRSQRLRTASPDQGLAIVKAPGNYRALRSHPLMWTWPSTSRR